MYGAGNQQERLKLANWIVGFTDGEGCFSAGIITNSTTRFGKQIFPEFVLAQGAKSSSVLKEVKDFFECGNIFSEQARGQSSGRYVPILRTICFRPKFTNHSIL